MIRIVKMHFRDDMAQVFLDFFDTVHHKISHFPGCKGVQLLRSTENPSIFFTYSQWDADESLQAYRTSELFKDTWKKTKAMFQEKAEAWSVDVMR